MLETRRVTSHTAKTFDEEELTVLVVWEPNVKKEDLKKQNIFSKQHEVLIFNGHSYDFKQKRA
ncbi:hypothetical protein [Robertmurraya siralis]|uniref:hypothetical protein n=1 Tax=Robertmurraya siralis TaxID=77777 RepID=UPI0010F50E42|nr:hypothetical protein [Robertmurraya siralis]